jgi:dienelactone hydrolase
MKRFISLGLFCMVCLCWSFQIEAQTNYQLEQNLHYYPAAVEQKDAYIASQCKLDLYYPKGQEKFTTIVWFHGGGLTAGSKEIPKALMEKGYAVIGVGYRLSPKATVPAIIEDAAAAMAWIFQHIGEYGGDPDKLILTGHSAGGYLGMMVTLDKSYLAKYSIDANRIEALIPFSGQAISHFTYRKEQGMSALQPTIDKYAPLFHVRADAPAMMLITGDRELELYGRYEENAYLKRMMQLVGHKKTSLYELDGFDHGGMPEPAFPLLLRLIKSGFSNQNGLKR